MGGICKEKQEIQDKLEKQRRKALKTLIKLEQHETSILSKLIEKRSSDYEIQKTENEYERSEVISEIQKLQSTLDNLVAHHREEEIMMEKSIEMDKDRLEIVRNTLQKNREDFEDKSQTYMEMESPMVRAKFYNIDMEEIEEEEEVGEETRGCREAQGAPGSEDSFKSAKEE